MIRICRTTTLALSAIGLLLVMPGQAALAAAKSCYVNEITLTPTSTWSVMEIDVVVVGGETQELFGGNIMSKSKTFDLTEHLSASDNGKQVYLQYVRQKNKKQKDCSGADYTLVYHETLGGPWRYKLTNEDKCKDANDYKAACVPVE